jgi:hypothetical protein
MNKKTLGKIIAGLLVAVMLCSVFSGVLSAGIWNESSQKPEIITGMRGVAYADITAGEAKAMLQTDPNLILLDVRTPVRGACRFPAI